MNLRTGGAALLGAWVSLSGSIAALAAPTEGPRWVQIQAQTKEERTEIASCGVSIEALRSDSVWGFATSRGLDCAARKGRRLLGSYNASVGRGGHEGIFDFPAKDSKFHNYAEMIDALQALASQNPEMARLVSIGKTIEKRDIWALHINTDQNALKQSASGKPGVIYMGNHHAREHVSAEIPLMFAQHLLKNKGDRQMAEMLASRDIWIVPMINPDGVEWDIASGKYRMWRKNRRNNGDGTWGVDLNRNYGYMWGTGGSEKDTSSDVYMGQEPFSEPETQAVRDFVRSQTNVKVLLTFHTFSELILYPWGHKYAGVDKSRDKAVFEKMAHTMSGWNHYTPQQASQLYIASGDTCDWAYGELGIFAFTFELSPRDSWSGGGFYPGQKILDHVFEDNLKPALYLLEVASDPYRVIDSAYIPSVGGLNSLGLQIQNDR